MLKKQYFVLEKQQKQFFPDKRQFFRIFEPKTNKKTVFWGGG